MAKISKEDKDQLNVTVTITIEKAEYINAYNNTLKKYQGEASLKGFRKGKTPMSYLRKVFGKKVLVDEINERLSNEMDKVLKELDYVGEPLANENQPSNEFDPMRPTDYTFMFDLGLKPEFELQGLGKDSDYNGYNVKVSDAAVEKDLEGLRKRHGKQEEVEDGAQEKDLLLVEATEMDGDAIKLDGHFAEFSISPDMATEDLKNQLLGKMPGDTLIINVHDVEKDSDKEKVNQYILGIPKDNPDGVGEMFECEITKITRATPAEMNQEFFDEAFGEGNVSSEEEARERIRIDIRGHYMESADRMLFAKVQKNLIEQNQIPMPEEFLKRWIKESNKNKITDEQLDREFPFFMEELRWNIIRDRILTDNNVKVEEEDIMRQVRQRVSQIIPNPTDDMVANFLKYYESDEKQMRELVEEVVGDKLFNVVMGAVTVNREDVDEEQMTNFIKEENERIEKENEARRKAINPESVEEKNEEEAVEEEA